MVMTITNPDGSIVTVGVTLDEAFPALDRTLSEQGLETFTAWLRQQDQAELVNPIEPCECFLHEYLTAVYPWGEWYIRYEDLKEDTLNLYYDIHDLPKWYSRFQRNLGCSKVNYAKAVGVAEDLLYQASIELVDEDGEEDGDY